MPKTIAAALQRAHYLLDNAHNAALATVNLDGSPHNTPFFFIHDSALELVYWASNPQALHSQNAVRSGQVLYVLYEANEGGGLYIQADQAHELDDQELDVGLAIYNQQRASSGRAPLSAERYSAPSDERLYSAQPITFFVNIKDQRHEVTRQSLLH